MKGCSSDQRVWMVLAQLLLASLHLCWTSGLLVNAFIWMTPDRPPLSCRLSLNLCLRAAKEGMSHWEHDNIDGWD
ncbi:hypothetical protein BKA67DRAFT_551146 [Truncatella angustata]|uniref:Uncharacterized protein n=1 Tax=Truncatella angustata TaxID=152316 RepID=A0A9P8V097_9PEZI|nr:uncharacterized protein BKA67DRAFT_551146 [Truncatella angustata]KAH6661418.1 hypothetical protein BKA67DRAFT_551146 [Truncatella angustata]